MDLLIGSVLTGWLIWEYNMILDRTVDESMIRWANFHVEYHDYSMSDFVCDYSVVVFNWVERCTIGYKGFVDRVKLYN